ASLAEFPCGCLYLVFIQRRADGAVGLDALGNANPQVPRHDRFGEADEEIVEVVTDLALDLEQVTKAGGGDQAGAGALALENRVGDKGGRVNNRVSAVEQLGFGGAKTIDAGEYRTFSGLGRCQDFFDADAAIGRIDHGEVGKGTADVHSKKNGTGHGSEAPNWSVSFKTDKKRLSRLVDMSTRCLRARCRGDSETTVPESSQFIEQNQLPPASGWPRLRILMRRDAGVLSLQFIRTNISKNARLPTFRTDRAAAAVQPAKRQIHGTNDHREDSFAHRGPSCCSGTDRPSGSRAHHVSRLVRGELRSCARGVRRQEAV